MPGRTDDAFAHYATGNALRLKIAAVSVRGDHARPSIAASTAFTAEAFAERHGGCDAPDPIFIVGMPRAGSTLVEQILSSHSLVEGTSELPDIPMLARSAGAYPEAVARCSARTSAVRSARNICKRARRPAPDRQALLRRQAAEQLDVRAVHPADPAERQDHRRAPPSARLLLLQLPPAFRARPGVHLRSRATSAAIMRDYVRLMAHVDAVLPGRVHRVIYERMVDDTESRGPAAARLLRPGVRARVPRILQDRAGGAHRELGAGAPSRSTAMRRKSGVLTSHSSDR